VLRSADRVSSGVLTLAVSIGVVAVAGTADGQLQFIGP